MRKGLSELREGLRRIRTELNEHFQDLEALPAEDRFGKTMWRFVGESSDRLEDLVDQVTLAEATFNEALKYYGEEDKTMTSTEFFGVFKTFLTSYKVCRSLTESQIQSPDVFNAEMQSRKYLSCRREGCC